MIRTGTAGDILDSMPRVVGIHGIAQQLGGEDVLEANWLPSLRSGLRLAKAQPIEAGDFRCAFYGSLFRKKAKREGGYPLLRARDVKDLWEAQVLDQLWLQASQLDRNVPAPGLAVRASTPRSVQAALAALSKARFLTGLLERALIWNLKQVRQYLHDDSVREFAQQSLASVIGPDTRVVVAHSLGSIVAYETLSAPHPEWNVKTLVTVGSPLGIANLIFDRLRPAPVDHRGAWPNVTHWYNIAAEGDVVALVKELAPLFGEKLQDRLIGNETRAHDVTAYLTARETGEAIASGLD